VTLWRRAVGLLPRAARGLPIIRNASHMAPAGPAGTVAAAGTAAPTGTVASQVPCGSCQPGLSRCTARNTCLSRSLGGARSLYAVRGRCNWLPPRANDRGLWGWGPGPNCAGVGPSAPTPAGPRAPQVAKGWPDGRKGPGMTDMGRRCPAKFPWQCPSRACCPWPRPWLSNGRLPS
jgi:hypothetical protein